MPSRPPSHCVPVPTLHRSDSDDSKPAPAKQHKRLGLLGGKSAAPDSDSDAESASGDARSKG